MESRATGGTAGDPAQSVAMGSPRTLTRALLLIAGTLVLAPWFMSSPGSSVSNWLSNSVILFLCIALADLLVHLRSGSYRDLLPGSSLLVMAGSGIAFEVEVLFIVAAFLALGLFFLEVLSILLDHVRRGGAAVVLLFYLVPVVDGSVLLTLPRCQGTTTALSSGDAIFTAISAVTVTGLTTIDIGERLSTEGQYLLLGLIQIGGLGVISIFAFFALALGNGLGIRQGRALRDALDGVGVSELKRLLITIVLATVAVESIGILLLLICGDHLSLKSALFHSVSAFCNAGFSLQKTSLENWSTAPRMVMSLLIVLGGLGFPVLLDLWRCKIRGEGVRLPIQTRLIISVTSILLVSGGLLVWITGAGADSWFWSVTARTAGFHTSSASELPMAAAMIVICLMAVGASPGSTGGGLKTSTVGVLFLSARAEFNGSSTTVVWKRTIPDPVIKTAAVLTLVGGVLWLLLLFVLVIVETESLREGRVQLLDLAFEVTSALATVGLSRDVTSSLGDGGRWIIALAMLLGRLGPLALVLGLASISTVRPHGERPAGKVMLG